MDSGRTNSEFSCSVIIPCHNENENLVECIERVPSMGKTEIVVVDDGSSDRTLATAQMMAKADKRVRVVALEHNYGKGYAVSQGIQASTGDIVVILDADMTVRPEQLPDFVEAVASQAADFISGNRFFYPMEAGAMKHLNHLGNRFFSFFVTFVAGSPCSDTLCGTKAFRRKDFSNLRISDRSWGDFDLIFHAAHRKLSMGEIAVHYHERRSGESKMKPFQSGYRFLSQCVSKWAEIQ